MHVCVHAKSPQSCPTLCNPVDHSLPGSSVHGILQATVMEWVVLPSSRGSSRPRGWTRVSCLQHWQVRSLPLAPPGKAYIEYQFSSVAQSCLTLCDPMNCSTAGLPVHHQLPEFTQTQVHWVVRVYMALNIKIGDSDSLLLEWMNWDLSTFYFMIHLVLEILEQELFSVIGHFIVS